MIAKCRQIPHGAKAMSYNNHKEKAELVGSHGFPPGTDLDDFWPMMRTKLVQKRMEIKAWKPLKHAALRFEVSPENKYNEDWTLDDWLELAKEFLKEVDNVDHRMPMKDRPPMALDKTDLCNSMWVATLHHDSKSGIRHLHILVSRVNMDGYTNDAHYIGERAVQAANAITKRRGWDLATDRREMNIENVHGDAIAVLRAMDEFTWPEFDRRMTKKDYKVKFNRDSNGKVRGYSLTKGHTTYKSSQLGHGRDLTPKKIFLTWQKLHGLDKRKMDVPTLKPANTSIANTKSQPTMERSANNGSPVVKMLHYPVKVDDKTYYVDVVRDTLHQLAAEVRAVAGELPNATAKKLVAVGDVAMLLFAGYLDAATSMSESIGGGGSPSTGWGKKDDEDDLKWLRRCVAQSVQLCKPRLKMKR